MHRPQNCPATQLNDSICVYVSCMTLVPSHAVPASAHLVRIWSAPSTKARTTHVAVAVGPRQCWWVHMDSVLQNISAPFICEVPPFKATLDQAIGMADFVFGNETEAAAFGKVEGWEATDIAEIALKIAETKAGAKKPTVVRNPSHTCRTQACVLSCHLHFSARMCRLASFCRQCRVCVHACMPCIAH